MKFEFKFKSVAEMSQYIALLEDKLYQMDIGMYSDESDKEQIVNHISKLSSRLEY